MSSPKDIVHAKTESRRTSIAKLKISPASESPFTSLSPRYGSVNNSYKNSLTFGRHQAKGSSQALVDSSSNTDSFSEDNNDEALKYGRGGFLSKTEDSMSDLVNDSHLMSSFSKHLNTDSQSILTQEGADITRDLYRISDKNSQHLLKRAKSTSSLDTYSDGVSLAGSLMVPGGFRRDFVLKNASNSWKKRHAGFLTKNFIEFLSIYGHFAGEDLEDEEDLTVCHYVPIQSNDEALSEHIPLLESERRITNPNGTASNRKAFFLLLKAFVGTGILFLPKAFSNGGLLFSIITLTFFGIISFWCYHLLIMVKVATGVSSFADIGFKLYGKWLQRLILFSIVISQIGFVSAYIVFTGENLRAFVSNVTGFPIERLSITWFILGQSIVFLPLSLIRDITKLSVSSLVANIFILSGLATVLYFTAYEFFVTNNGKIAPSVEMGFNKQRFSLFIGVAIFAFEGIGLIIPIQESMMHPEQFSKILFLVIITISIFFIGIGTLGYLTFGENVETVILLNLPQNSPFIIGTQFLYAIAILLSAPLQLFPAIRLVEQKLFSSSGRASIVVKWKKNILRFSSVFLISVVALYGGKNLDLFVSFVGCFACIPLVYMYPSLLHLKGCCKKTGAQLTSTREQVRNLIINYAFIGIGLLAVIYSTVSLLSM